MTRALALLALASFAGSMSQPGYGAEQSAPRDEHEASALAVRLGEMAQTSGMKLLLYSEVHDVGPDDREMIAIGIIAQPAESRQLVTMRGDQLAPFMEAVHAESAASGWRRIRIVTEDDTLAVEHGPSVGTVEGFNSRLRAEVDRTFPGHL